MNKVLLVLSLLLTSCAAHVIHPGTANSFDSSAYDTLLVTDSVIQSTKADLVANKFPASIAGNVKTALNDLITAYDAADAVYCGQPVQGGTASSLVCAPGSYHAAAIAGTATAAQQAAVQADLTTVNAKAASLATAKGGQ